MSNERVIPFDPSHRGSPVILHEDIGILDLRVDFTGLPTTLQAARDDYFTLSDAMRKLEKRQELLKQHIINKLGKASNKEQNVAEEFKSEGIRYLSYFQQNTKWREAAQAIITELVPKTKHGDAEVIINGFTSSSIREKLELDNGVGSIPS